MQGIKEGSVRPTKLIYGATPESLARTSEVNHQRKQNTNKTIVRAIFGYLQQTKETQKVDM